MKKQWDHCCHDLEMEDFDRLVKFGSVVRFGAGEVVCQPKKVFFFLFICFFIYLFFLFLFSFSFSLLIIIFFFFVFLDRKYFNLD